MRISYGDASVEFDPETIVGQLPPEFPIYFVGAGLVGLGLIYALLSHGTRARGRRKVRA